MADPATTREITVRDALTHRSGLSGGDLLWASGDFPATTSSVRFASFGDLGLRDSVRLLQHHVHRGRPGRGGRGARTARRAPRDRILAPLRMTATTTSIRDLPAGADVATPHDPHRWSPPGPLAEHGQHARRRRINSTRPRHGRWLRFQLNHGSLDGVRLVSSGWVDEMLTPQILIRREGLGEV